MKSHLAELDRLFNRLEMKLLRGHLDRWPLFSEEFGLMTGAKHRFASRSAIDVDELRRCICATQLLSPNIEATVYLHGVVGRQRTAAASAILTMLRAADWSRHTT